MTVNGKIGLHIASAAFLLLGGISPALAQSYQGQTLRIGSYGGSSGATYAKISAEPFKQRTGADTVWSEGAGLDYIAQLTAAKGGEPPYDIVFIEGTLEQQMVEQGLVVKPDLAKIPSAKLLADNAVMPSGFGLAYCYYRLGLAYLPDKLKAAGIAVPPQDMSVIFDPRMGGHVAIPDVTQANWTLITPSIAAFLGNSFNDPKPTLTKLAGIKNLILYNSSSDLEARTTSGEVWASLWVDGRVNGLKLKGVPIELGTEGIPNPKGGTYTFTSILGVVEITNPAKKALAEQWIDVFLSTPVQVKFSQATTYTPTNREAQQIASKDPKVGAMIDTDTSRYFQFDLAAWTAAQDRWIEAWGKSMRR